MCDLTSDSKHIMKLFSVTDEKISIYIKHYKLLQTKNKMTTKTTTELLIQNKCIFRYSLNCATWAINRKVRRTPRLIASGAVHLSEVFFRSELKDGTCASSNSDT